MSPGYALALAFVIAIIYMIIVRLIDVNEREPLWAIATMFGAGAVAAALVKAVESPSIELNIFAAAAVSEIGKFVALLAGFAILGSVARLRGWSELNGLMDGVIYGVAAGLGYATATIFLRQISLGGEVAVLVGTSGWTLLWTAALGGLAHGMFGGITGAGFGAAVDAGETSRRVGLPLAGFVAAFLVHVVYRYIAEAGALTGRSAVIRSWVALAIPLVLLLVFIVLALRRERTAIAEELADEAASGTVTDAELELLRNPAERRRQYARTFFSGDFDGWTALRALHNRQVQLAMLERRLRQTPPDQPQAQQLRAEEERLRASIAAARQQVDRVLDTPPARGAAS